MQSFIAGSVAESYWPKWVLGVSSNWGFMNTKRPLACYQYDSLL